MRRLEKYLVECGAGTRKEIKIAVADGRVSVNGVTVLDERIDVFPESDLITLDGKTLQYKEMRYYIMYKVAGYITAMKDERKATVADLLPEWVEKKALFPVGRLDKDTEGMLLFTNDGDLCYEMTHPDKKFKKTYYAELDREITEEDLDRLREGVIIDSYKCLPAEVEKIESKKIYLTITEGKYHQVKKMLKAVKNKVIYLKRIKFGNLELGDMIPGEVREIIKQDIQN